MRLRRLSKPASWFKISAHGCSVSCWKNDRSGQRRLKQSVCLPKAKSKSRTEHLYQSAAELHSLWNKQPRNCPVLSLTARRAHNRFRSLFSSLLLLEKFPTNMIEFWRGCQAWFDDRFSYITSIQFPRKKAVSSTLSSLPTVVYSNGRTISSDQGPGNWARPTRENEKGKSSKAIAFYLPW